MYLIDTFPNIPRLYTAIAQWTACLIILLPHIKKSNWKSYLFVGLLGQILLQSWAGTWPLLFWIPGMLLNVGWMWLLIRQIVDASFAKLFYLCGKAFILSEFVAAFAWQILYHLSLSRPEVHTTLSLPITFGGYILFFAFYYFIEKKLSRDVTKSTYLKSDVWFIFFTTAIIFLMSNIGFLLMDTAYSIGDYVSIFTTRTLINGLGLCILFIKESQKQEMELQSELVSIDHLFRSQYEHYIAYKKSTEVIQRQFHDLKHQVEIIKRESDEEKREHYLEEMTTALDAYSATISTGHPVLDTILTSKNTDCIQQNISFTCFVDGKQLEFMRTMDICSLFGNALDNAIEAVKSVQCSKERIIDLRVIKKQDFLVITLKNTSLHPPTFHERGIPITTKKDKISHGYGVKNMYWVVEKYDGTLNIDWKNPWFSLKILIPLKRK